MSHEDTNVNKNLCPRRTHARATRRVTFLACSERTLALVYAVQVGWAGDVGGDCSSHARLARISRS